jgi:hypothetical protein
MIRYALNILTYGLRVFNKIFPIERPMHVIVVINMWKILQEVHPLVKTSLKLQCRNTIYTIFSEILFLY